MMRWWIADGVIVQAVISGIGLPGNFIEAEGPDLAIEVLYWDGESIQIKPDRPSSEHEWNGSQWEIFQRPELPQHPNWESMVGQLRGSMIMGKAYATACQNLPANAAFTALSDAFDRERLDDLEWAIEQMRAAMRETEIGDFTIAEIAWINQQLEAHHFSLRLIAN